MNSNKKTARIAGCIFLVLLISGIFAEFFVRYKIFVPDDIITTAKNIKDKHALFNLGIVSDMIMSTAYFFYAIFLYFIFKPVSKTFSLVLLSSSMVGVSILCLNTFNQIAASLLAGDGNYLGAFSQEQLNGLITFFLKMHINGYYVAQVFYGLYLFPLGYMIYRSGLIPKFIGVLLMLGFIGDIINFFNFFLFPKSEFILLDYVTLPADLGEVSLCLWLVIMGIREYKLETQIKSSTI